MSGKTIVNDSSPSPMSIEKVDGIADESKVVSEQSGASNIGFIDRTVS